MKGDQFLTVALNLLHRALVEAPRPQAKALFRRLQGEESVTLTNVRLEDQSTVRFDLALETSAYRGRLTFGALRAATGLLIHNIGESLRAGTMPTSFTAEKDSRQRLFGTTAVSMDDGVTNVLVLGARIDSDNPIVELQLLYLDPDQFTDREGAASEA